MKRRCAATALALVTLVSTAKADDVVPKLWRCSEAVFVNKARVDCGKVPLELKAEDLIELKSGDILVTDWIGMALHVEPGSSLRVPLRPPPPSSPSVAQRITEVFQLLFGGSKGPGILKSNPARPIRLVDLKLQNPGSLVVSEWKGEVRWQLPPRQPLALRVRDARGTLIGPARMLDEPVVELQNLNLGTAEEITLELLLLDTKPTGAPPYLRLPARVALEQPNRPVLAVLSTQLKRVAAPARKARLASLEKETQALAPDRIAQAAHWLAAGELTRARSLIQELTPAGVPEPWQRSLSGVKVEVAP